MWCELLCVLTGHKENMVVALMLLRMPPESALRDGSQSELGVQSPSWC